MMDPGPLLVLGIATGAIAFAVGARQFGSRLIGGSVALAVFLPIIVCAIGQPSVSLSPLVSTIGWVLGVVLVVALIAGWLSYVRQRRDLQRWREADERPPSLKRRRDSG